MPKQPAVIAPSILSADFARLGEEVNAVLAAGADWIHFDVMDQRFVPNLTVGPLVCQSLRQHGVTAPIDVHLMVEPVDMLIERFADAGATSLTFHPQASEDVAASIALAKSTGCKVGLAYNPETPLMSLPDYLDQLDMVLIMTVNPGFGGQSFMAEVMPKVAQVREWIDAGKHACRLQVDGGINLETITQAAKAGADTFVAGSAIFGAEDYAATVQAFSKSL